MGHISNPVGLRLGNTRAWLVKGTVDGYYQQYDLSNSLFTTAKSYFLKKKIRQLGFIFSHITFRQPNLGVYMTDARFEILFFRAAIYFKRVLKEIRFYRRFKYKLSFQPKVFKKRRLLITEYARRSMTYLRQPVLDIFRMVFFKNLAKFFSPEFFQSSCPNIEVYTLSNYSVTTKALGVYILRKLKAKNSLPGIIFPIIRGLRRFFKGIRIETAGRFTRKQRASFRMFWVGKVSLGNFSQPIDYSYYSIPLKYGVGSIKIWLARRNRFLTPYFRRAAYLN